MGGTSADALPEDVHGAHPHHGLSGASDKFPCCSPRAQLAAEVCRESNNRFLVTAHLEMTIGSPKEQVGSVLLGCGEEEWAASLTRGSNARSLTQCSWGK